MSGTQFLETLRQLGYPDADRLDPLMFDWLFEQDNMVPFLEWFSNNIHFSNIITAGEREEYRELEKNESQVLQGRQLEEALNNLALVNNEEDVSEETLSEDIARLQRELEENKTMKQELIQRRNKLSVHHTSLSHKLTKLSPLESYSKTEHKKKLENIQIDNNKVNESMEKLVDSVCRVTSLYDPVMKSNVTNESHTERVFLSQVNLDDYYHTEEKYTQEVTSFTRKQFFQRIGKMTGENDGSRFELLEIKDPESLLIHGENDENILQDCKELNRLQSVFGVSETDRICGVIEDKKVKAAMNTADEIRNGLQLGEFPIDTNKLSTQLQESQSCLQTVRRDLSNILEGDLQLLIRELAPLQGTQILTGDYNLKLARQDYFTSNQDKVIQLLVAQKSRHEFLAMAYEKEAKHHRDIHRILTASRLQLQNHLKDWKNRMTLMDDPVLTMNKYQRGTIDTRDTSTTRLHRILDQGSGSREEKPLFLTYSSLLETGENLYHRHQATQAAMLNTATKHYDKLHILEWNIKTCEETIYKDSSTTSGQPVLSPPQVQDTIKELGDLLQKLEVLIVDSLREVNNKKLTLKNDNLLTRERTLFVDFFLNPERIQQALDKISNRLQTMCLQ